MHYITFDLCSLHEHGSAYFDYLRLRKRYFVDQLGWPIAHNDKVEMDQYDNPETYYALVQDDAGKVLGGARCMPTTAIWGDDRFMVVDASDGRMPGIPAHIMPRIKASEFLWETSRLVISDEIETREERYECLGLIIEGMVDILTRHGATNLMALSSVAMLRTLRQIGYDVSRMGKSYRDGDDGRLYCVMQMPAVSAGQMIAAE